MPDFSIFTDYFDIYMKGFFNTIIASVIALIGSFLLGTVIAIFRIGSVKPLQWIGLPM